MMAYKLFLLLFCTPRNWDSNDERTNSDNMSIADKPVTTSELENDITGDV